LNGGTVSVNIHDSGVNIDSMTAYGTSNAYGSSFHFGNWEIPWGLHPRLYDAASSRGFVTGPAATSVCQENTNSSTEGGTGGAFGPRRVPPERGIRRGPEWSASSAARLPRVLLFANQVVA
jgi:hypothetical protein